MRTAIYIRTSTKEQNPQNQLDGCNSVNKWGDCEVFEDKQSAWKDTENRPNFEKIIQLIKLKEIDHLIVWDLDRIYRRYDKISGFFELCKAYGCKVHSYRQAWLESLNDVPYPWRDIMMDFLIKVFGYIGQEESDKKSARVKASVVRTGDEPTKSYKGKKWGRKPLPEDIILQIFELRTGNPDISVREIAKRVTYWDKNRNLKRISKSTVQKLLGESNGQNDSFLPSP